MTDVRHDTEGERLATLEADVRHLRAQMERVDKHLTMLSEAHHQSALSSADFHRRILDQLSAASEREQRIERKMPTRPVIIWGGGIALMIALFAALLGDDRLLRAIPMIDPGVTPVQERQGVP